jgi:DNA processing protein
MGGAAGAHDGDDRVVGDGDPGPAPAPAAPGSGPAAAADALAVIASTDGLGPISFDRLLEAFGGADEILAVAIGPDGARDLRAAARDPDEPGRSSLTARAAAALVERARNPGPLLAAMRAAGVLAVALGDPRYPGRLRTIELPPRVLFVRGDPGVLNVPHVVGVVGTRRPTDQGRRTASRIGASLARAGAVVVSGLAVGIDGVAHAAVLGAGGTTVAVIGGGHDRLFPRAHLRLADAIVAGGGAILSEHAPGTEPTRGTFPRRNRIISGLVEAVVVVEAGAHSGALVTAAWALEQGRECFLVPGSIDAPQSAGCLAWLRDYAGVARIVAGVPQLLEDLGLPAAAAFVPTSDAAREGATRGHGSLVPAAGPPRTAKLAAIVLDLPPREGAVLRALAVGAATADEVAAVSRLPIGAVLAGLTGLEERGLVVGRLGRYRVPEEVVESPVPAPERAGQPAA